MIMKGLEIGEKEGDVTMSPLHTLSSLSFILVACHVPRLFLSPPSSGCGREILSCEESVTENLRNPAGINNSTHRAGVYTAVLFF
jgi:hypothetical protein